MKKVVVISLGGSLIIPDKINIKLLEEFKKVLHKNKHKFKFIVICGGGKTARTYIEGLNKIGSKGKTYLQSLLGIAATRLNARFMTYFFGKESNTGMPNDMHEVENLLKFNDIVFCGALRYAKNQTSDATAAKLAKHFNTFFINLTNVSGLHDKNPLTNKNARFIPEISYKDFLKMAKKEKFKPGQHFPLDTSAAKIIKKNNIRTYILGPEMKNLDNLLNDSHFVGSVISKHE